MPRHRKSKAKELVHIDTLTGDAVYLDPSFECMVLFGESTYIPKLARDLTAGDVILNLEYIGKIHLPIDRLRPILTAGSARYREAYRSNYRSVGNIEMTLLSHSLLGGLQNEGGLEAIVAGPATRRIAEDIAKVHMMAAVDEYNSRKEEFDVETNQFLDPSDEQVANWLSGATLAPRDWRYFEAFSAYGDGTQEKPDWRQMASWKKDPENRFYRQYTALVSYHRVFSQILNQFEDIIEVSGLEKPSQQSRESSERMETGYADDLRALLSRMGIKRRDRAVAVVSGHPTIETVNKEDSAFREIKGLPEEDAGYLAQDLGRMMNEYSLLLALCAKALEDTLTKDTRDSKDVMLAVWSYL